MSDLPFEPTDEAGIPEHPYVRVDVRGQDPAKWAEHRPRFIRETIPKLLESMNKFLDTTLDYDEGTTIREEAKRFTSSMLDFAREKLRREGVEVAKIEAEISELYAKRLETIAHTQQLAAQAQEQRRATALKQLCATLALTRGMLIGETGEEALLFGRQIEEFLRIIKELNLISES